MADNNTYIVQKGDTLTKIANANNTTVDALAKLNNISNINLIYVGQELILSGEAKTTPSQTKTAYITHFGLQANTDRNVFITWEWWNEKQTENYEVQWYYDNGDVNDKGETHWHPESIVTTTYKESIYTADTIVKRVKVTVKPVAKQIDQSSAYLSNEQGNKLYFEVEPSAAKVYSFDTKALKKPDVPEISIEGTTLTIELDNLTDDKVGTIDGIEFEIVKDDLEVCSTQRIIVSTMSVTYTYDKCSKDSSYKARCRGFYETSTSDWSDYTSKVYSAATEPQIVDIIVTSATSAAVTFKKTSGKKYKLEYTYRNPLYTTDILKNENYFDVIGADIKSTEIDITNVTVEDNRITRDITGLQSGFIYYVRVSVASSFTGTSSKWSEVKSFVVGLTPGPATIWASKTTIKVGEELKLYWMHNPKDSSVHSGAQMNYQIGTYKYDETGKRTFIPNQFENDEGLMVDADFTQTFPPYEWDEGNLFIKAYKRDPDNISDQTYVCEINTSSSRLGEGSSIRWRVKTSGVIKDNYGNFIFGDWSDWNIVDIYSEPKATAIITDGLGESNGVISAYPLQVQTSVNDTPNQLPTGYYISITNIDEYETVNNIGNAETILADSVVYSKYINSRSRELITSISAEDVTLRNDVRYRLTITVSMDSGLTAETSHTFIVKWDQDLVIPLGTVYINEFDLTASIRTYINTEDDDFTLSVYRKEYDGSFTKIQTNMKNDSTCVDKYPSLNYARYRVIAKSSTTGAVSYNDIQPKLVGKKYVVIQWNDGTENLLRLKYNIDIIKKHNPDVSLVEYIGREHPVSYYGTQLGETETWKTVIPKTDEDTLYDIRRLARWMGDVYVRESSGLGYPANITISYNREHRSLVIPITLTITRVEGGN